MACLSACQQVTLFAQQSNIETGQKTQNLVQLDSVTSVSLMSTSETNVRYQNRKKLDQQPRSRFCVQK